MERIGFIGTYDKTDFIIYVARVLVELGKKVLVIDSTVNQKAKYVVPAINPTVSYVTEYEGIDVAVGFKDYNGIKQYLGMQHLSIAFNTDNLFRISTIKQERGTAYPFSRRFSFSLSAIF